MLLTERYKDIIDTQTIILLHLDRIKSKEDGRESAGILTIARTYSIDPATVRRNLKGDGKRHKYEKSLLGRWLVIEVRKNAKTEYLITEKGRIEISERKVVMKKIVGE